jgi:hypothetical protein
VERRDRLRPGGDRVCVFVSSWGARLNHNATQRAFDQIRRAAGVTGSSRGRWPRAHDLRHTFAVNTLLGWYHNGDDVAAGQREERLELEAVEADDGHLGAEVLRQLRRGVREPGLLPPAFAATTIRCMPRGLSGRAGAKTHDPGSVRHVPYC